ncbi:MAG: 4'-phosphopantetheinyl transferase superfamily protein [Rhodocyclaceae bacterium]
MPSTALAATQPLALPASAPADIQVRLLDLSRCADVCDHALEHLSDPERARAARYHHAADARRFVMARSALREWLGLVLGTPPSQLDIHNGPHGKPQLANHALQFSVSHAGHYALLALSPTHSLGVDIEACEPERPLANIARQAFTPSERTLCDAHPDRAAMFYALWTGKEAVLKAWGSGIDERIQSFSLQPQGDAMTLYKHGSAQGGGTRVWRLQAPEGYAAALAVSGA